MDVVCTNLSASYIERQMNVPVLMFIYFRSLVFSLVFATLIAYVSQMMPFPIIVFFSYEGETGTYVFGSIRNGVFDGKIVTPKGSYYVEHAKKYFPSATASDFHSVIYSENDVLDPHSSLKNGEYCWCFREMYM